MNEAPLDQQRSNDPNETAVHCYLSTILATADCIARLCPDVGVPYQNRWRRLPQRIGFDPSLRSLETSGRMFQSDLERFADLAGRYFSDGFNLVYSIGVDSAQPFEKAIQETASHANLLDALAESLDETADLDASTELGGALVLQSEGLRRSARQMRNGLLPSLDTLSGIVRECRRIVKQTQQDAILDVSTGFVNNRGFRYELKARYDESQHSLVLLIDFTATLAGGQECSDEDFLTIATEVAARLGDQFRPWDCLGRVAPRRFAVIFEGDYSIAKDRSGQISRSITGTYSGGISVCATVDAMEASDADSLLTVLAAIDKVADPV
jgi:GGDEF domain-containing protein